MVLSQQAVYMQVKRVISFTVYHASGGLCDARGVSDVDLVAWAASPAAVAALLPPATAASVESDHTVYHLSGYAREVNLYVTSLWREVMVSRTHRAMARWLEVRYPLLAMRARQLKAGGLSTEEAWADVLGLSGDPYQRFLDVTAVKRAAVSG